jgi:ABC-type polysaccharide/polyol phosphate export permease
MKEIKVFIATLLFFLFFLLAVPFFLSQISSFYPPISFLVGVVIAGSLFGSGYYGYRFTKWVSSKLKSK